MEILNSGMPEAAHRAFQQAHQARAGKATHNRTRQKQTEVRDYRLTLPYMQWRDDERAYRERRANTRRGDIQALEARTFLHTRATPKLTARRLQIAKAQAAADMVRIQRARSPERQRAAMQRHMNTVTYSILKARGLK